MQDNFELVQRGFRLLLTSMSGYIGREMNRVYRDEWWNEVRDALYDQRDLLVAGTYEELVDSLDLANCFRLIDRRWHDVFRFKMSLNGRTLAKELMGVRNIVAHIGQQDLEQPMSERALDTMALLCAEMDPDAVEDIRKIYREVRAKAADAVPQPKIIVNGAEQPFFRSKSGEAAEDSLLNMIGTDLVQRTTLTRKVTYAGKTVVYPVYKVRLEALYYNDQNDRIATWITQYESENGADSLSNLDIDIYNRIIENFICDSNPEAIQKTQKNIALVGQREPGVTLADGRIVDGNRRFTCLRRLQRGQGEPLYFETVIMDVDIHEDKKQIKLLELSIQHGEEKKVDYDLIDYAIGTYRDIVQTNLLTIGEYASSTNEAVADVKKRLDIAGIICEFLEYIGLPEQYHVAREYQVYSLFQEMLGPLRQLNDEEKDRLKKIAFDNVIIKGILDQRKFIRDIKGLIKNDAYEEYFEEQKKWNAVIQEKLKGIDVRSKGDIDQMAEENMDLADKMRLSMERALLKARSRKLKEKPAENVSRCISLLMDVETRFFDRMNEDEKENLKTELDELIRIANTFKTML